MKANFKIKRKNVKITHIKKEGKNMENTKENINIEKQENQYNNSSQNNQEQETTMFEKKILVYLIIITIILIFIAIFFIHNIVDKATINSSQTAAITYPDNNPDDMDYTNDGNGNNNGNETNPTIVEGDARLKIFEGTKEWSELRELNIFHRTHDPVVDDKIAPGVQDTYTYTVECYGDYSMLYNLVFQEENPLNINMKYKMKYNGKYVAGDENTWVDYDALTQTGLTIKPGTVDVFTLDWRWEDADNDTEIGQTDGAKYILNVLSSAEAIID